VSIPGDYTSEHGAEVTKGLLSAADPPTAILYDNDVMAIAGLAVAQRMGVSVPEGVSILSWDDSPTCEVMHPSVTALRRDISAAGVTAARMLRDLATGRRPGNQAEAEPTLQVRMSSGPAPAPAGQRPAHAV
jgi:DNA-binding LacI/PurR family transcriptional regulator